MKVKICGLKQVEHAITAIESGADYLGFVFAQSPRQVTVDAAASIIRQLPPDVIKVGVFVDEKVETVNRIISYCGLDMVQLHGMEPPEYCDKVRRPVIKAFRVKDAGIFDDIKSYRGKTEAFLLDTYVSGQTGGTGKTFDWKLAIEAGPLGKIILAGGLNPENVRVAVETVKPFAVDVSGGVETKGIKDSEKIMKFIKQAKGE